jgi:hypothetical protein
LQIIGDFDEVRHQGPGPMLRTTIGLTEADETRL